jgi:hypothetical protein
MPCCLDLMLVGTNTRQSINLYIKQDHSHICLTNDYHSVSWKKKHMLFFIKMGVSISITVLS